MWFGFSVITCFRVSKLRTVALLVFRHQGTLNESTTSLVVAELMKILVRQGASRMAFNRFIEEYTTPV